MAAASHLGRIFEDICTEILVEMAKKNILPLRMEKIGKWWKEAEIDVVSLESKGKRALAIEVKFTELSYQEVKKLLSELAIKAKKIHNTKECILGVMAKENRGTKKKFEMRAS
jgi:AAA+ ATPase superfamily predicted ATPase